MKFLKLGAVFLVALLAAAVLAFSVAKPALAAEAASPVCTWPNDNDVPAGTTNQVTSCMIAGHPVRMVAGEDASYAELCGEPFVLQKISVWVDGVKIVDRRDTSEPAWCIDATSKLVNSISIDDKLRLTLCETLGTTVRGTPYAKKDLKPGQSNVEVANVNAAGTMGYAISECTTTPLTSAATADPLYGVRTPPGMVADISSPDCTAVSDAFADPYSMMLTSALSDYPSAILTVGGKPIESATDDEMAKGSVSQYQLDVDGDGVTDVVRLTSQPAYYDAPPSYSWLSGASGLVYRLDAFSLGIGEYSQLGGLTFIHTMSGVRLYYTTVDVGRYSAGAEELARQETDYGSIPDATTFSRRVYALSPEGTAKVVCQWSPRKRPEEFM